MPDAEARDQGVVELELLLHELVRLRRRADRSDPADARVPLLPLGVLREPGEDVGPPVDLGNGSFAIYGRDPFDNLIELYQTGA